jgi:hypothetical protein
MKPTLHLHEFFVEGGNPEVSHVLLNITEPSTPSEKEKGYFFAICEINNAETKDIARMQNIIDKIENNYYEIPDQNEQTAMEIILDKINKENLSITQPEISLHCLVGAIREESIIFSFYGHPQMMLFYKTKDGFYKKMDLISQSKSNEHGDAPDVSLDEQNDEKQAQLFSQIIQGKIGLDDLFFAGTPHIAEYFNHDRLQKIITTRPPRQSSEHLQKVLSELQNNLSFGGIIINLQENASAPVSAKYSPAKTGGSAKSLKNLFNTEQNTANILSPSFLPKFQDKIKKEEMMPENAGIHAKINSSHLRARTAKIKATTGANFDESIKKLFVFIWKIIKYAVRGVAQIFLFIGAVLSTLARNLLLLFFIITNYKNRRHNILTEWARWRRNLKENIARLPLITKVLLNLSIILLLTFSGGIAYIGAKQKKEASAAAYAKAAQNIKLATDEAESSLVYNDNAAALAAIKEAEQILKKLSCFIASEKINCQNLQGRLAKLLIKARKTVIARPQLLADWNNLMSSPNDKSQQINNIFLLNNKIYAFGQKTADVIIYDPLVKESKLFAPGVSVKNFTAVSVPKENDYAVLLYDNKSIVQFKPQNNSWKKVDIDYPNQDVKITDIFVYNRRLYSLDAQNNQIYKHDGIKTGFSTGKEWIQNNTAELNAGIDLTIDGDVFSLSKNGAVYKYTNGAIQPFAISGIDPQLTSANKIFTYNDLNYIYILDTQNKRIVLLDKTGRLKSQITADEFSYPADMIIEEQNAAAYVLDSNKLYQISL